MKTNFIFEYDGLKFQYKMADSLMEMYQLIYISVIEMLIFWISVLVTICAIGCDAKRNVDNSRTSIQMFGFEHVCSAMIMSENVVVTSAECITSSIPREYQIHVGNRHGSRHIHNVQEVIVHPNFNPETNENNIAMLVLAININFTSAVAVRIPICPKMPQRGAMVRITGWEELVNSGISDENKTSTEIDSEPKKSILDLQDVNVKLISNKKCNQYYDGEVNLNNTICAESPGKGKFCHGDGGGPLIDIQNINNQLIDCLAGITSMEYGCPVSPTPDNPNPTTFPGIYTNIMKYRKWIEEAVVQHNGRLAGSKRT